MTVVTLEDAHDGETYGGKATQLGAGMRAGLPVPPGLAVAHALVDAIAESGTLPAAIVDGFAALAGPVAVRSSAVGEDGASASFAGQHATVLGVSSPEALLAAIRAVRDSARSPSALAYRARLGLAGTPRMGVVVQRLVDAEKAGVLFTRNPMTGADERVVEAAWGLGEIVVAGIVTPDHFRIARDGRILERRAGDKDIAIRRGPDGRTEEVAVEAEQAAALCLADQELEALHQLALRCEAHAKAPQDIEWAFAQDRLFLLQQRAVTRSA